MIRLLCVAIFMSLIVSKPCSGNNSLNSPAWIFVHGLSSARFLGFQRGYSAGAVGIDPPAQHQRWEEVYISDHGI